MHQMNFLYSIRRFLTLSLFFWLALTSLVSAHASLTGTEPADGSVVDTAPQSFSLSFSEPVSPLTLKLLRPDGSASVLTGFALHDQTVKIVAPDKLDDGTHVLTWRVVSSDGHPVGGSVIFSIGVASAAPSELVETSDLKVSTAVWLAKLILFITLFIGIGGAFAVYWFWPAQRPARRFMQAILSAGFVVTALSLGLQGLDALGVGFTDFFDLSVWETAYNTSYGQTVILLLLAIIVAFIALSISGKKAAKLLSLIAVIAGAGAPALSGHASAAEPQWLTRPAVFFHALTITLWVGALIPLGTALYRNNSNTNDGLRRLSSFIPYALLVLIIAGVTLAVIQVQQPLALLETAYGQLLLAKLAVLFVLFLLAAYNRWKLTEPVMKNDSTASKKLARAIIVETLLVLVIFGIASGWRFTPPPRSIAIAAAQPATVHIHTDKAMADVAVTPGRTGSVVVSAVLMDGDFAALEAQEVTFVFANPDAGIEPFRRKAVKTENGNWEATDVLLPLAGTWRIRLDILINDFELARIEENIQIRP